MRTLRELLVAAGVTLCPLLNAACVGSMSTAEPREGAPGTPKGPPGAPNGAPGGANGSPGQPVVPGVTPTNPGAPPLSPGVQAAVCQKRGVGRAPLRRLTRFELLNTVRDLFGPDAPLPDDLPSDPRLDGFDTASEGLTVSPALVTAYAASAEALGAWAGKRLAQLLPCSFDGGGRVVGDELACGRTFVRQFGRRAYRHKLDDAEAARLDQLFTKVRTAEGFGPAVEAVVETVLLSPRFLYRVELGQPATTGTLRRLDPFETATRLSYLLWGSMPDDALLDAAERGELGTPEQVAAAAARLAKSDRAKEVVAKFHRDWLGLEAIDGLTKNAEHFPSFTPALRTSLRQETETFIARVFDAETINTLFAAPYSFMNAEVARFYGEGQTAAGATHERVNLDARRRAGLLTHAGLLASTAKPEETSPVMRGKYVRFRVLCGSVPPPPPDVEGELPPRRDDQTTRERFEQHTHDASCASCHQFLDPIGFLFESYDAAGRWRERDGNKPINSRGSVVGVTDAALTAPLADAVALSNALADSEAARTCYVQQWFRFGFGRTPASEDACSVSTIAQAFQSSGHRLSSVLTGLVASDAFLFTANEESKK